MPLCQALRWPIIGATGSKSLPVLLFGATVAGVLGVLLIQFITQYTRVKADSAIGIVLSVFFGIGIVLLTHIQRAGGGNQSGLDKFLLAKPHLWLAMIYA